MKFLTKIFNSLKSQDHRPKEITLKISSSLKEFVQNAISNYEARPFKVAKNIKMMVVDLKTGKKADFGSKTTIIEAFKKEDLSKNLDNNNYLNLKVDKNNILKFY